ncbi:MAG: prepilin-type N-terminal cleavage/methylation domain-containing protein [Desulfovibrio sp.]
MNTSSPNKPAASKQGFTLLEVLISMALAATIGMVAYTMYDNVLQSTMHARKYMDGNEERRAFFRILSADLERIFPQKNTMAVPFTLLEINSAQINEDPFLTFASSNRLSPSQKEYRGLVTVEYSTQKRGELFDIVRRERDFSGVFADFPWRTYTLIRGIKDIKVQFWDELTNSFAGTWGNSKINSYPPAMRFTVTFPSGEEHELVVKLIRGVVTQ